jgi:hypothetical protein
MRLFALGAFALGAFILYSVAMTSPFTLLLILSVTAVSPDS